MTTTAVSGGRVDGLVAREYLRVSVDSSGRERSPEEQHRDHEALAGERGWVLGPAYRDVGSASRYAQKARAGFDQLMADLESGHFGAAVLVLWEASRGSRREGEWVRLVEAAAAAGVLIHVFTHRRSYDPTNARDRRSLLEDAIDSAYESSKISERARRSVAANAAAGRPHGGPAPYGYRRTYDPSTGRALGWEIEPGEAAVVREFFDRVARGHSIRSIVRDFADRGVEKRSGGAFTQEHMRTLLGRRAYIAERVHNPGAGNGSQTTGGRSITPATWEPIVARETFFAVQRILSDPKRRTTKGGKARHVLSMILRCGVCGAPLAVTYRRAGGTSRRREMYQCHWSGCVRTDKPPVDEIVIAAMLVYLASEKVYQHLATPEGQGEQLQQVRDRLTAARAELDELHDLAGRGQASIRLVARAEPQIQARITQLETEERHLTTPTALHTLLAPGTDIEQRWHQAPISTRREIARLLLTPDMLGEVHITRSPRRGGQHPVPAPQRIQWHRNGADGPYIQPPPPPTPPDPTALEQEVRTRVRAGHSQRTIARDLDIDRGKVRRIIHTTSQH